MRDECIGIPPRFECEFCPSKFRRKYHLVRHLNSRHSDSISQEHTGIIVNNREKIKMLANQQQSTSDEEQTDTPLSSTKKENVSMNPSAAAAAAAAAELATHLAKDFSVEAIMMKREPCDPMPPELKFFEELQKKMNFQVNSELFSTLRQMNPIKY